MFYVFSACKGTKLFWYIIPFLYLIVEILFPKALNLDKYSPMVWKMGK